MLQTEQQVKKTIYVSNICSQACIQEDLLLAAFIPFGDVVSINVSKDPSTN